ncbi:hypothetical protein HPB50_012443 [Hyalomma asiaticum]|uniref:Uncharacterized protein n=1 Tax=Hyalomma asiaticum TaxID=266040 RepID=A0ACB7RU75_HYAAI|nr:hypothetical protein HPB50_012443 [Hyalomma asiaticum]
MGNGGVVQPEHFKQAFSQTAHSFDFLNRSKHGQPHDLSLVVPDEAAVCTVLDVMGEYGSASGARVNRSKSAVMYLNAAQGSAQPVHGLPVRDRLRILGFHFEPGGLTPENWQLAQEKLEARIREIKVLSSLDLDMLPTRSFASYFLCTQFSPNAPSHCVRRAGTPSPFYASAAKTLAALHRVDPDYEVGSVKLQDLVDVLTPELPGHLRRFDLSWDKPSWKLITASFLDAKRATFMYRFARGCLPITFRPFTAIPLRGVCPFCGAREDFVHIFWQCVLPEALLRRLAYLFQLPGVPFPSVRFLNPLPSHAVNQFVLLLVECSYEVWVAR